MFEPLDNMAAQSPREDDFNLFLSENGHLSFDNPNYQVIQEPSGSLTPTSGITSALPKSQIYRNLKVESCFNILKFVILTSILIVVDRRTHYSRPFNIKGQ